MTDRVGARIWRRLGGWLGMFDTVIHVAPFRWIVPEPVQERVCARFDRRIRADEFPPGPPEAAA